MESEWRDQAFLNDRRAMWGRRIFGMSEHEKYEQVGRLAEEYSMLKGELNHIETKLGRAHKSYQQAAQAFQNFTVQHGLLVCLSSPHHDIHGLLGIEELTHTILDRDRLKKELEVAATRLRAVAPHLV